MLFSKGCEYGLRAMIYVATHGEDPDEFVPIRRISKELDISFHFLTKIFQQLNEERIIESYRGPRGGIRLARPASKIRLMEIVVTLEGPGLFSECVMGLPGCGDLAPCPLHDGWSEQRDRLAGLLKSMTLAEASRQIAAEGLRIGP